MACASGVCEPGVAAPMTALPTFLQADLLDELRRAPAPLAGDRLGRLHRLAPAREPAAPGSAGHLDGQLRHRPSAQPRSGAGAGGRGRLVAPPPSSAATSRCRPIACGPATAWTSCCIRRRWARCRARWPTRRPPTWPTPRASSTCWWPRGMPRCSASSTRRRAPPTAIQPSLPKIEDVIGKPLSPYVRHQVPQRVVRRRVRPLLRAGDRRPCATSTSSAHARTPTAPTPR